jgi:hypothetical protein
MAARLRRLFKPVEQALQIGAMVLLDLDEGQVQAGLPLQAHRRTLDRHAVADPAAGKLGRAPRSCRRSLAVGEDEYGRIVSELDPAQRFMRHVARPLPSHRHRKLR